MKTLYITQVLPYPPDSGGKIKTYQILRLLGKKHQVYLVCFAPSLSSPSFKKQLESVCRRVEVIVSPYPAAQFKDVKLFIFRSLFSPLPFIVFRHWNKKMQDLVKKLVEQESFEAIHIDHLNMASYLPREKKCLWVLEEHNLESEINWGIVKREKWNKFKAFSFLEAIKLTIYEKRIIPKFDYIFAISKEDRKKLIKLGAKKEKVFFLPTAFKIKPLFGYKLCQPTILFVGMLSWWPNKDGFSWFYKEIFPLIKLKIPNVKFVVIGKEAGKEMIGLSKKDSNLKLVGYVKNLEERLVQAGVFVVPLRAGSGIRIKILTALAAGIPVVSTKKGAEGISSRSGNGIILADKPEDFAKAVVRVLSNEKIAGKLSSQGLEFIQTHYSQEKGQAILDRVYK